MIVTRALESEAMSKPSVLEVCSQVAHPEWVSVGRGVMLSDLLDELREAKAEISEYIDRLCPKCGYYAPENEKEWPNSECVVCFQHTEIERLRGELARAQRRVADAWRSDAEEELFGI